MHGTPFQIATYCLVVLILGYWLSAALKTWQHRATFFLTLLVTTVLVHSTVGIVATAIPSIACIIFFERERNRGKRASRHAGARDRAFASFPVQKWDGIVPVVRFDTTQVLHGEEVFAFINAQPPSANIRLCACRPVYMESLAAEDLGFLYGGACELPEKVRRALDRLNKEISACGPISWEQDETAIDIADLRERAKAQVNLPKETVS